MHIVRGKLFTFSLFNFSLKLVDKRLFQIFINKENQERYFIESWIVFLAVCYIQKALN